MQNPFAHGNFRDRSRPFIVVVIILLGLLFVAAFFVKPVWRAFKDRRAEAFVRQANLAIQTNNASLAATHLRSAFALSPALHSVNRALAEHYTRLRRSEALTFWQWLDDQGSLSFDEQVRFARLAVDLNAWEEASRMVEKVTAQQPRNPDCLSLVSGLHLLQGDTSAAIAAAEEAARLAPERRDLVRDLSILQLRQGRSPAEREDAKSRLISEVIAGGPAGVEAARALLVHGQLTEGDTSLLRRLLAQQGNLAFEAKLVSLLMELKERPEVAADTLAAFRRTHLSSADQPEFVRTVQAMLEADLTPLIKDLLLESDVLASPELTAIRLESLGRSRDWAGMEQLLSQPRKEPLPKAIRQVYLAMAAQLAGRTNEVGQLWKLAVSANQHQPEILRLIALRAEEARNFGEAAAAWERLLDFPDKALEAARQLVRLGEQGGNLRFSYLGTRKLAKRFPGKTELRFELARLQILLDLNPDEVKATVAIAENKPGTPAAALLLALSALRDHNGDLALECLQRTRADWAQGPQPGRVILAAALSATGQYSEARNVAALVDESRLSAQEVSLIRDLLPKIPQ